MKPIYADDLPHRVVDLRKREFEGFEVVSFSRLRESGSHRAVWWCRCRCGRMFEALGHHLTSKDTTSCGCARKALAAELGRSKRTARHDHPGEYRVYRGMLTRCFNESAAAYRNYGGRGVTVCDDWRESFDNFLRDMGPRPSSAHTLERVDNDGDYGPENCVWLPRRQQAANCRTNRKVTFRGRTMNLGEWAKQCGIRSGTIAARLDRGWPVSRALTTPVDTRRRRK